MTALLPKPRFPRFKTRGRFTCRWKRKTCPVRCQFVGERGHNASEYHDHDFDWNALCVADGEVAVARQREEYRRSVLTNQTVHRESYSDLWEDFHLAHSTGRFFKEKRYLTMAFPRLLEAYIDDSTSGGRVHVLGEIGCGGGSALIPVLRDNPHAVAVACDVSSKAIDIFRSACDGAGIDSDRVRLCVHAAGSSTAIQHSPFQTGSLDTMLLIFTLSAFHPNDMISVLREAYVSLQENGMVLLRDYGLYDMAQLRFHGSQLVDDDHLVYKRADGTLSYFFSTEFLENIFRQAGFSTVECRYVTTYVRNIKKQVTMKRVYVHGVFKKQ